MGMTDISCTDKDTIAVHKYVFSTIIHTYVFGRNAKIEQSYNERKILI